MSYIETEFVRIRYLANLIGISIGDLIDLTMRDVKKLLRGRISSDNYALVYKSIPYLKAAIRRRQNRDTMRRFRLRKRCINAQ
jgi:hypothetical protein